METTNMAIYSFKKGDEIVRIDSAKPYGGNGVRDRSYLGEKLIFLGIANGCLYVQRTNEFELHFFGNSPVKLPLDVWDEGWDYYQDPNSFLIGKESEMSNQMIQQLINRAVDSENYEEAERLKRLLK